MFTTLISATLISLFAVQGALADFAVNTPVLTECEPAQITWAKATRPYNLAVVPASDPCDSVLVDIGDFNGTTTSWKVNLTAGTEVFISVLDANDEDAWSGKITVQKGNSTSCLSTSSASAASSKGTGTTLVIGASPTSASTTSAAVAVGAANAGDVPNSSGAIPSVHLSTAATVVGTFAAILAAFAL